MTLSFPRSDFCCGRARFSFAGMRAAFGMWNGVQIDFQKHLERRLEFF
jgi:hypothetical protein